MTRKEGISEPLKGVSTWLALALSKKGAVLVIPVVSLRRRDKRSEL
jgi:hypothetical protein